MACHPIDERFFAVLREFQDYSFVRETYKSANMEKPLSQAGEVEIARTLDCPSIAPRPLDRRASRNVRERRPLATPKLPGVYHILKHRDGLPFENGIGTTLCGDTLLLEASKYLSSRVLFFAEIRDGLCHDCLQTWQARCRKDYSGLKTIRHGGKLA